MYRVVPDSSSGKYRIRPFFTNLVKSGPGHISTFIWQIPLQLQSVQFINTTDLPSDVFTIFNIIIINIVVVNLLVIAVSCMMLTVCLEMHPVSDTNGSYDTQHYLKLMNNSINFDR